MIEAWDIVMLIHLLNMTPIEAERLIKRHRATLAWVRTSCERDGLPAWLTELVVKETRWQMLDPLYPLMKEEANQP